MGPSLCIAYSKYPVSQKLLQLRAKTDRQILNLIHSKLEQAAGQCLEGAEQAFNEAQHLFPALPDEHRWKVAPKLIAIRETLEDLRRLR
jgi:hypothetical protein